jgi:hypothetical protein
MTAKTCKARTEAFFSALAETGNQTISAERARVSRGWVSLHRSTDPAFRARMEAAITDARARLSSAVAVKPSGKWATIDGERLVVRGSGGRGGGRRVQLSRARLKQWTVAEEKRFLAVLSATCNVRLACKEVGLSIASAYGHRSRWYEFAKCWDAAVEDGYHALEIAMLERAVISLDPHAYDQLEEWAPALPISPMTPEQCLSLLHMHKGSAFRFWAQRNGLRGWGSNSNAEMSSDELNESIMKKLRVLAKRRGVDVDDG